MEREKSCGALVFRLPEDVASPAPPDILLIRHRKGGHWSFPKGHVEAGESERQTALREVREETGLRIKLVSGFRHSVEYAPKPGVQKQVVYFLGYEIGGLLRPQEEEISELRWFSCPKHSGASPTTTISICCVAPNAGLPSTATSSSPGAPKRTQT